MTSLSDIRTSFLTFFEGKGHEIVPSSSLVPASDPTLLFTNAGMVPFKNVFTGLETRAVKRAVSAQKCVRAGGKHNDLDNVGYTARHHTFFEMLGNFSFDDYFKEAAIAYAWELVGQVFALPKDRLIVTVYAEDEEAAGLWRKIAGFPDSRIVRIGTSDNFWSMGDTGPCGPCSEIFYDYGDTVKGGPPGSADADGDRFVEFWNLVFMQFDQGADGRRTPLPKPSIDTGMGLERIASILQGKTDNYDTDLFQRLIAASSELTRTRAAGEHAASHRVIADHLRAACFLIADGVLPSNEGRGYVLRRILRRGMRHAHMLGAQQPLFYRLVPTLIGEMGAAYGDLKRAEASITATLRQEEEKFRDLLERGLKLLDEAVEGLSGRKVLPGEVAFRLYDTFGFPLDLTEDALRRQGITVDRDGFDAAMDRQRAESRANWAGSGEEATEDVWFAVREKAGATRFLGYERTSAEGRIAAILKDGAPAEGAKAGETFFFVADQTPFYAESGGQVGDAGAFFSAHGAEGVVLDTHKRLGDLHVHEARLDHGRVKVGDTIDLKVDAARRDETRANHSATHLLHEALRRVLGAHVTQKGSLVAPDRLRFDFSHGKSLSVDEVAEIEAIVNRVIRANSDVGTRLMAPAAAMEAGALALFGEKYGDEVRVLSMGEEPEPAAKGPGRPHFSVELCGGTHVRRLGDIQLFKVISEGAVGSGVRRIEALTGEAARRYLLEEERVLLAAADALKSQPSEVPERVRSLLEERRRLEKELSEAKRALAMGGGAGAAPANRTKTVGRFKLMSDVIEGLPPKDLRGLVDAGKEELGSGIVAFVGVSDGKAAIAVGVTQDLTGEISAVDLVRAGVEALGGKGGGGRPDMAQAGGPHVSGAQGALESIADLLAAMG